MVASTGKPEAHDYLRQLGASEILSREEVSADSTRPLEAQRWAGSVDTVGGTTLAYLMRTTKKGGAIAAIGVAGGATFSTTVYPLILRGIKILGIDMPSTPVEVRRELWEEVTRESALLNSVDSIVSEVSLEDIPRLDFGVSLLQKVDICQIQQALSCIHMLRALMLFSRGQHPFI